MSRWHEDDVLQRGGVRGCADEGGRTQGYWILNSFQTIDISTPRMTPKCTMAPHGVINRMHAVVTAAAFPNSLFALFFRSIAQQRKKFVTIKNTWQHQSALREMQHSLLLKRPSGGGSRQ